MSLYWIFNKYTRADLAQLGERQTEENQSTANLEVLCSIHRVRIPFYFSFEKKSKFHACVRYLSINDLKHCVSSSINVHWWFLVPWHSVMSGIDRKSVYCPLIMGIYFDNLRIKRNLYSKLLIFMSSLYAIMFYNFWKKSCL